jgi:hypothetical protein
MPETSDPRARFQHDIFLEVLVNFGHGLQLGVMTVRAALGRWNPYGLVDVLWLGPLPRGMAHRSATLAPSGAGTLWFWGHRSCAPFELAAVQGVQLRPKLLVLQLHRLALSPFLPPLLIKLLQLIFIVTFGARNLLVASEDPAGGQPLQIGAPIPIRAAEVRRQVLKFGHD